MTKIRKAANAYEKEANTATPDTGCTRTIIKTATANKWRIPYRKGDPTVLLTASGERLTVDGSVKLKAEANGIHVSLDALVSNAIQDEMLVSHKDLISLRIIPGGFLNTIIQKCREVTGIEPKEMLLEE